MRKHELIRKQWRLKNMLSKARAPILSKSASYYVRSWGSEFVSSDKDASFNL